MWIAKGTLLALWLFGFGTMAWLYFAVYSHLPGNSAVDIRVITALTIRDPLWWGALVVCLVLCYGIARSCSGPLLFVDCVGSDGNRPGWFSRTVSRLRVQTEAH